jgi:hypothetical protein
MEYCSAVSYGGIVMPLFRLSGLALFITAIFLAMVAAITKTTHIRISNATQSPVPSGPVVLPPPIETGFSSAPQQVENAIQFTSVPIVWPMMIAAGVGLLMWFMLPSQTLRTSQDAKRRSRRQR